MRSYIEVGPNATKWAKCTNANSETTKQNSQGSNAGTGVELRISKTQMRNVIQQRGRDGGSLFSAVVPLARTLAPTLAKTLGLSALAGLASEGASQVAKKISGNGMKGGFLIPQDKIQKLLLTINIC